MKNKIVWLLVACLAILLIGLNQSLWLDEAISANVAKNYSLAGIVKDFSKSDFHPPLYYLVLKSWTSIFGLSEISLRMPSVMFSLVTIYVVYLIGGLGAAALTGFNPLFVYYSQETRMYSMVTMLLTIAIYFLIKKKYWWVSVFFGLSFLTFYGSVFLMVAVGLFLLIKGNIKGLAIVAVGPLLTLLILSPLMQQQFKTSQEMLTIVPNWKMVLGGANWKNLLMIPMKFSLGRISFYPKYFYYLVSGLWTLFVVIEMFEQQLMDPSKKKYFFLFWMSIMAGLLFSTAAPMLQYFRFLYLIPIMALSIRNNRFMVAGFIILSLVYVLNSNYYREDWKSLSKDLGQKVYMVSSFSDPVSYYRKDVKIDDIREKISDQEITVVPYGEIIHGIDHNQILATAGYQKTATKNYREITAETWTKKN